jgi:hypothetical protein
MKAYTDYPITALGDEPYKLAPVREVEVLSYDGDKYCRILVGGVKDTVKQGYLYQTAGRCGEAPCVTLDQLKEVEE